MTCLACPHTQDARIGDKFESFPPILQLHLKRFEYDFQRDMRVKVGHPQVAPLLPLLADVKRINGSARVA